MRAGRRRWMGIVIGLAGLLVAAGCGDGGDDAGSPRAEDEPTTTVGGPPVSVTIVEPTEPVAGAGDPRVTATPTRAPVGTRVRLDGSGFTGDPWQTGGGELWLADPRREGECVLLAPVTDHDVTVTADGRLAGTFVVPAHVDCQGAAGEAVVGPFRFDISYQCTDCRIGTFTVILAGESTEEPTGTPCEGTVAFAVQSFAAEIYADGLPCAEAEAFIRDHAGPWRAADGPDQVEAGGFSCERTGRSHDAYPFLGRANYVCASPSATISFTRQ